MQPPKDEMFVTSATDRREAAARRELLGCCGVVLVVTGLMGLALILILSGCAEVPERETPLAREIRQRWIRQQARDLERASRGVIFSPQPQTQKPKS